MENNLEKFYKMFSQLVELTNNEINTTVTIDTPENWKHIITSPTVTILTNRFGFIVDDGSTAYCLNLLPTLQISNVEYRRLLSDFINNSF